MRVNVYGMGYVGLTLAVTLAELGFTVMGVEKDFEKLEQLWRGVAPFYEKGLQEKLRQQNLTFVRQGRHADVHIICVGTPSVGTTKALEELVVGLELRPRDLVIFRSTVPIGTTRKLAAMLPGNVDVAMAPERTIEGNALVELRTNAQVVGGSERAVDFFRRITTGPVTHVSSLEAAEMSKLLDNCWRVWRFSFANRVALDCEDLGLNAWEVIEATKKEFPRSDIPSPGFSLGPCLSKDPLLYGMAFDESLWGVHPFVQHGLNVNRDVWELNLMGLTGKRVGLLGATFKGSPPTDDLRDGPLEILRRRGVKPLVYDENVEAFKNPGYYYDVWRDSDVVIVGTNSFKDADPLDFLMPPEGVVIDMWNTWPNYKWRKDIKYKVLGKGN